MKGRCIALVTAALAVVAMVVAFTALSWANRAAAEREAVRTDAVAVGPALVESVLSYNSPTVDADLDRAAQAATGGFRERFTDYATKTVAPQSKEQGISTRARVVDVGFVSGTDDHAQLLMFVDQITTSTAQPAPASATSRVEVGLDLVDGQWRIAELTPV
ncbi:hypothetical protein ACWDUM_14760 [Rhodococcus sp. NPDC003322]